MGVTIEYFTKSDVTPDQRTDIIAASNEPDHQPWLLCEPIVFLDMPGYENQLFGASKLNLMPAPEDKADAEAHHNAEKNDLEFLLDKLTEMSQRFKVDWQIQIEGEPVGSIDNGTCDPAARDAVESMADIAGELGDLGDLGDFM